MYSRYQMIHNGKKYRTGHVGEIAEEDKAIYLDLD
jgi:hypothetical protein